MNTQATSQSNPVRHPFGELLAHYRTRKPGLTQTHLAELAGYDQAVLVRMAQGKKDLTGPSGRERVVRLIETLADQGALTTLDEANGLLMAADMPPLFERQPAEARLTSRLSRASASHRVRRTNLPAPLSAFVGRAQEVVEVRRLLSETRLVTLTGAGGCGKTRLAQQAAADVLITYPDGVWYVELAALTDPALIADAVARVFGLTTSDRPVLEQLADFLRERHTLLVMDNCEHMIEGAADFAIKLLGECARLTILATSREALNIEGEATWRVPPMLPDEAAQLFVERARLARPSQSLAVGDATVAQICQRLDGMPLAIELAAARLQSLSLSDIAARLDDRFNLLNGRRRGALPRHQTLQALIDWSYDALSEPERVVFRRLGVFVGGWELEQAEQVVDVTSSTFQPNVLLALTQLIAKSLVTVDDREDVTRYFYLETIREYAQEKLTDYGELQIVRSRHAEAFAVLSEQSIIPLRGGGQKAWIKRLERDRANVRAALTWSFAENGNCLIGSRIVASLMHFWDMSPGNFREVRHWYAEAMQTLSEATPPLVHAGVLNGACYLEVQAKQISDLIEFGQAALKFYRDAGDKSGMAFALCQVGINQFETGQDAEGESHIEQGISLAQELGDDWVMRFGLSRLSNSAYLRGNVERASVLNERLLEMCHKAEDWQMAASALLRLTEFALDTYQFAKALDYAREAEVLSATIGDHDNELDAKMRKAQAIFYIGDHHLALSILDECLALAQQYSRWIAIVKGYIARVMNAQGDHQNAQQLLSQQLKTYLETTGIQGMQHHYTGELFDFMACVAITRGDMQHGCRLFGAGESVYVSVTIARLSRHEWEFAPYIAKARTAFGDQAYEAAYAEGRAMTLEQAIDYALASTDLGG